MSVLTTIEVPEGKHVVRILDNTGHTDLVYDPLTKEGLDEAIAGFEEQMAKKATPFKLDAGSESVLSRDELDQTAEQVVIVAQYVGG